MFRTPPRRKLDASDAPIVAQAVSDAARSARTRSRLELGRGGPLVVVLHGWGSHAARFGNFIAPLRAAGFSVIGIDAPAHGASPGRISDLPFSRRLAEVLRTHEPVHAVIGHSLGGGAIAHACSRRRREFHPQKICLFGVPSDMDYILESFAMMLGLKPRALAALRAHFEKKFGRSARDISVAAAAPQRARARAGGARRRRQRRAVRAGRRAGRGDSGRAVASTQGLGHSGGLRDAATIERVMAFLRGS